MVSVHGPADVLPVQGIFQGDGHAHFGEGDGGPAGAGGLTAP